MTLTIKENMCGIVYCTMHVHVRCFDDSLPLSLSLSLHYPLVSFKAQSLIDITDLFENSNEIPERASQMYCFSYLAFP